MGQQPRFPNQAVKVKIGIVGRPDLDVHRVLCRRGDGFRRPVIDGVEDHAAVGRFLAGGLRRRIDQARELFRQLHGAVLRVPDPLGKAVGIHVDAGKAEAHGTAEFLHNMLRPAAGGRHIHIVQPPGKGHRLTAHRVHSPRWVRCKGVLCCRVNRAVGQRADAAGFAVFDLLRDDA